MSLDVDESTGLISGTPTVACFYQVVAKVTDANGVSAGQEWNMPVNQ